MTHDVVQWLNEIRSLQERLVRLNQERAEAYQQASRWHQSYQTEASQRRADVKRLDQRIHSLVAENQRLKQQLSAVSVPMIPPPPPPPHPTIPKQWGDHAVVVPPPTQPEVPQQKLSEATELSDRLSQALRQEQRDHAQTRQTLMEALSDLVEQLERERKRQTVPTDSPVPAMADAHSINPHFMEAKPPSLPPASLGDEN
ncbi:MAG: hypothetical protein AB4042_06390 [Leptolyngbyaceae cyanobacterium]